MSFSVGNMLPRKNVQNTASILYRQKEGLMCAKCLQSVNYYTMSIVMNRPSAKTPIPESTPSTNGRGLSVFLRFFSDGEPTERSRIIRIASATMSSFRFGDAPSRSMKYASLKIGLSVSRI